MGISFASSAIVLPKSILLLLVFMDLVHYSITTILSCMGMYPSSERPNPPSFENIITVLGLSQEKPSDDITPCSIKNQLPIVEFANKLQEKEEEEVSCVVCLGRLEEKNQIRELGNCRHAFHKECIDKWVDVGQVTCPVCRAMLLPSKPRAKKGREIRSYSCSFKLW